EADLDSVQTRLIRAWATANERAAVKVESLARHLNSVGPESVLKRGFSYTMREDGHLVRSVADAKPGDVLSTTVPDGKIRSVVSGQSGQSQPAQVQPAQSPPSRPVKKATPSRGEGPDQMDLFGGSR